MDVQPGHLPGGKAVTNRGPDGYAAKSAFASSWFIWRKQNSIFMVFLYFLFCDFKKIKVFLSL